MGGVQGWAELAEDRGKNEPELGSGEDFVGRNKEIPQHKVSAILPVEIAWNELPDLHELFPGHELEVIHGVQIEGQENSIVNISVIGLKALIFLPEDQQNYCFAFLLEELGGPSRVLARKVGQIILEVVVGLLRQRQILLVEAAFALDGLLDLEDIANYLFF